MHSLWRWLAVMFVVWSGAGASLLALNPLRALTQFQNDRWQIEQGLPQNTVQAMTQTRDGYLWIGTLDGLARFDGISFTVFDGRTTPELGSGSVLGLMQDAEGNLWIGRSGAAVIYRDGRFRVAFDETVTAGTSVWSFVQANDGAVWAATNNGLVRWQNGNVRAFHVADGLPTERLRSLTFDAAGTLWIGTSGGGLVSYANGTFTTRNPASGFPHAEVRAVLTDPAGGIWAATAGGGLVHLRGSTLKTYTVANGLPTNQLSALTRDAQGTLWIGTWGAGLVRMTGETFSSLTSSGGLGADQIWSLYADREGSVWIGTWVGGLNRLRDRRFQVLGVPEGLSHDNTRAVLTAADGAIWVATAGGGVNRIDGDRVTSLRVKDGLPSDETSSLWQTRDGAIWVGTNTGGIARVHDGRITRFGVAQGLPGLDVRALYQDRAGTLWAATMAGLARFEGGRFVAVHSAAAPLDGVVTMMEDRAGTMWFGTANAGLARLRAGEFHLFTTKDGLASNKILALHEDARGSLWVGTINGITRVRDDRLVTIRAANGLWDGVAEAILEDRAGNVWMTCNRGFYQVPLAELDAFADGTRTSVTSVGYGLSDALRSPTFAGGQSPSGAIDAHGRLWLPSYKGLVIVDPANVPAAVAPPAIRVDRVEVNGVPVPVGEQINIPPGADTLSIRFSPVTLIDADRVRFRWRLNPLSATWAETEHEAFFLNPPNGAYQFEVASSVDGVTWGQAVTPLRVVVQPFFYQATWFSVLAAMLVVGVIAGGVRWRLNWHERREAELQRRVNDALAEVDTLHGLLPICAWCKKIRNDGGYWEQIEVYVRDHSAATFTHGICPDCVEKVSAPEPKRRATDKLT